MRHDDHTMPPSTLALRIKAIETLMVEKGKIDPGAVTEIVDIFQNKLGPRIGAGVVARAWSDPAFKARLLDDGTKALKEMGVGGLQGEAMIILENTPEVHNVCRRHGTNLHLIAAASSASRDQYLRNSNWIFPGTARCVFSIAMRKSATWFCRSALPVRRDGARKNWQLSSPVTP